MEEKKYKLDFEPVPDGCWYSNLRTLLPKNVWDAVRKKAYSNSGGKCAICGAGGRLEAHERWNYDEKTHIQSLADVIAVCHACHSVIHIGRTQLMGNEEAAIKHFMKVNGCTYAEYRKALGRANELNAKRNKIEWMLDVRYLDEFMNR